MVYNKTISTYMCCGCEVSTNVKCCYFVYFQKKKKVICIPSRSTWRASRKSFCTMKHNRICSQFCVLVLTSDLRSSGTSGKSKLTLFCYWFSYLFTFEQDKTRNRLKILQHEYPASWLEVLDLYPK